MSEYEMNIGQATEIIERACTMIDFMAFTFATSTDVSQIDGAGVFEILSRAHTEIMDGIEAIRFNYRVDPASA